MQSAWAVLLEGGLIGAIECVGPSGLFVCVAGSPGLWPRHRMCRPFGPISRFARAVKRESSTPEADEKFLVNFCKILSSLPNTSVYTVYMVMHSWISITLGDPRPLYLQIIEQVKRRVAVGDLPPGSELPSIRQLASDLKISVITIKRAYLELEREGVIFTRQGKGSIVAERPGLQASIQEEELREHLEQAASLGLLLGKSKTEMQRRIAEAFEKAQKA